MALLDYSANEALERIYKMLSNAVNPSDVEGLLGQMPWDEALTRIAQLLEGSLGDATFDFPAVAAASDTAAGVIELADVDEANARYADSLGTRALTPEGHHWAHEFGGIYVATGTVDQAFTQDTWTKVTGTFHASMSNSGEVAGDWNDDRITFVEPSDYLVNWQLSWFTWSAGTPKAQVQIYVNGTAQPQTRSILTFGASGTVANMSGVGIVDVISGSYAVDLRANLSAGATMHVETAQISAVKLVGG